MSEIPKDGKSYLAWNNDKGMGTVVAKLASLCILDAPKPHWEYLFEYSSRIYCTSDETEFARWMDERGQWHEIGDK